MSHRNSLFSIRLELARTDGFPNGSSQHGYEFVAPLTTAGHVDAEAWRAARERCLVRRFWPGEDDQQGLLRHVGKGWRFDYGHGDHVDDEPFFKLDRHAFVPGSYVSITEHDGVQRPFRVVDVTPLLDQGAAA